MSNYVARAFVIPVLAVVAVLVGLAPPAAAQPLTDRVPADAYAYIGWRGADALGPAYANSHLAGVVSAMNLKDVRERTIPSILTKVAQTNQVDVTQLQANLPLLERAWKRPTVLFVAPGAGAKSEPRLAILCDVGEGAADVHRSLTALLQQAGHGAAEAKTATDGRFVALTFGYPDAAAALKPTTTLRDAAGFAGALKQVDADAAYTAFVDVEQITKVIDQRMTAGNSKKDDAKTWATVRDSLGLGGLKRIITTGGFAGQEWSTRTFIEAPPPRRGLLSLLGEQQVRESTLKLIPQSASYAMVKQFDPAKVLLLVRQAVAAMGPDAQREVDQALAKATQAIGMDVREVLEPLGDQWAIFGASEPKFAALGEGLAAVNQLDDAARAEAALTKLTAAVVRLSTNSQFALTARDQQAGDTTVHSLLTPQAQPSWAVHKGKLFAAMSPQGVTAAIRASDAAGGGETIARNDQFAALIKRLGAPRMSGFEFADLARTAAINYPQMQGILVGLGMMAAPQGIWVPGDLLPPLEKLRPHLTPGGSVSWVDETGWHSRGVTSFPGSRLLTGQQGTLVAVGVVSLGVSIILPSLNRARETANRVKCAANERQIAMAILLYANEHRGQYPPDQGTLILTQDITPEVFTCPSSDNEVPAEIQKAAKAAQAKWVNENSSYVYVGQGKTTAAGADDLVLYEKEGDHGPDGLNMMFGDGHVEWLPMGDARETIATKKLKNPARQQRPRR